MTIYRKFDNIEGEYTACIGFFDGVHKGHQFLLEHLKAEAKAHGMMSAVLLDFTEDVRNLTAEEFIRDMLREKMHIRRLLIGYDHRFGRNRAEGFDDYVRYGKACGMDVVREPVFDDGSGLHYSSSEVRRALSEGDVEKAQRILGWDNSKGF